MTSFRQFRANRRNALRSTGPRTVDGKRRSRTNAVRHGLTAETVIGTLEDAEDYKAFEANIIADYCAETAVARELVLRLASLLWRLRRATGIETDLLQFKQRRYRAATPKRAVRTLKRSVQLSRSSGPLWAAYRNIPAMFRSRSLIMGCRMTSNPPSKVDVARPVRQLTYCWLRIGNLGDGAFERLNRYETALWRQALQIILALHPINSDETWTFLSGEVHREGSVHFPKRIAERNSLAPLNLALPTQAQCAQVMLASPAPICSEGAKLTVLTPCPEVNRAFASLMRAPPSRGWCDLRTSYRRMETNCHNALRSAREQRMKKRGDAAPMPSDTGQRPRR